MIIGILKEIKKEENRVSMTPGGVELMKENGHTKMDQGLIFRNSSSNNR